MNNKICKIKGCQSSVTAKGYCNRHYKQMRTYGKVFRTRNDTNEIILYENHAEVLLYDSKGIIKAKTLIDIEDVNKVKDYKWCYKEGYVMSNTKGEYQSMHRLIMNPPKNKVIDHINHDTLDNRKNNLRICSVKENCRNRVNAKGVYYRKDRGKWRVGITKDGKTIYLGLFSDKEEAIQARRKAEVKYFGEFALSREEIQ